MATWGGLGCVIAVTLILAATLATARWGDRALWPPSPSVRVVEVFVINHGYHSGIVLPRAELARHAGERRLGPLAHVTTRFAVHEWLEFGWGDEGFYTQVPTLESLTVAIAVRALLRPGNRTVLHVVGVGAHPATAFAHFDVLRIELAETGFARLVERLDASFAQQAGEPEELGPGRYGPSLFFRATGAFHLFNVCNHWVAGLLDAAGVPTAPVLATLPPGLLFDLKWRSGIVPLPRATSAVDLTFASLSPTVRNANVKSKTALALNALLVFLWL